AEGCDPRLKKSHLDRMLVYVDAYADYLREELNGTGVTNLLLMYKGFDFEPISCSWADCRQVGKMSIVHRESITDSTPQQSLMTGPICWKSGMVGQLCASLSKLIGDQHRPTFGELWLDGDSGVNVWVWHNGVLKQCTIYYDGNRIPIAAKQAHYACRLLLRAPLWRLRLAERWAIFR
ncbi:MAG: hypothetical protein ACRCZF_07405, partial [Gemmataceae bacterium]